MTLIIFSDLFRWFEFQVSQRRLSYPLKLEGLPAEFSEQAKFDREKGFTPVRITFISGKDEEELFRDWPEARTPIDYKEEDDINAEGKYNPELYEAETSPITLNGSGDILNIDSDSDDVPDYSDGPLIEF